jgi:hypothetical protein
MPVLTNFLPKAAMTADCFEKDENLSVNDVNAFDFSPADNGER